MKEAFVQSSPWQELWAGLKESPFFSASCLLEVNAVPAFPCHHENCTTLLLSNGQALVSGGMTSTNSGSFVVIATAELYTP